MDLLYYSLFGPEDGGLGDGLDDGGADGPIKRGRGGRSGRGGSRGGGARTSRGNNLNLPMTDIR